MTNLPETILNWVDDAALLLVMPKEETSVLFSSIDNEYQFSDDFKMPLSIYDQYVEEKRGGEYPTEPKETSEAIFKARAYWEASS